MFSSKMVAASGSTRPLTRSPQALSLASRPAAGSFLRRSKLSLCCRCCRRPLLPLLRADILHCHDWQTAPIAWSDRAGAKCAFTIHNMNYGADLIGRAMETADVCTTVRGRGTVLCVCSVFPLPNVMRIEEGIGGAAYVCFAPCCGAGRAWMLFIAH